MHSRFISRLIQFSIAAVLLVSMAGCVVYDRGPGRYDYGDRGGYGDRGYYHHWGHDRW